jgi:hypothetical protein
VEETEKRELKVREDGDGSIEIVTCRLLDI